MNWGIKHWAAAALCAGSAVGLAASFACTGGQPCTEAEWVCGSDGKLWCRMVPPPAVKIDRACCPAAPPSWSADASTAVDPDAGVASPAPVDAGSPEVCQALAVPDFSQGMNDAGFSAEVFTILPHTDAGFGPFDDAGLYLAFTGDGGLALVGHDLGDGGLASVPPLHDDAGIPFLFRCGLEVCHPFPDGGYPHDAGPTSPCGPVGCQ